MFFVALKMLTGDRAKFLGIIFGITFSAMLITQQLSIFVGLMTRTYAFISDTTQPDLWVMDRKVQFADDIKPMQDTMLLRVRGVAGVEWAMPLYKGLIQARMENGTFQTCNVIGIDDATLIGGPPEMVKGTLDALRLADSVVVDEVGARRLAKPMPGAPLDAEGNIPADWPRRPLEIGDTLELNDRRAVVVGVCRISRTFQSQPVLYTTYSRALQYAPQQRKLLSFIVAKASPDQDIATLAKRIREQTGLAALNPWEFSVRTYMYFIKNTGIPISFGITVILGFVVGTAIAGQTFYNFTLDNLRQFGALKAMGTSNSRLLAMILLQALIVGLLGYGLGVGAASTFAYLKSELAFRLLWQTLVGTGVAITFICILASLLSIQKVIRLEPAIVFKG